MNNAPEIDPTAYDNADFIPGGAEYWDRWQTASERFRAAQTNMSLDTPYGAHPREAFDLFRPAGPSRGLFVFLHGGFWRMGDRKVWSHLAAGPLGAGWTVAVPSYPLCPEVRITEITGSIVKAMLVIGSRSDGRIVIAGHSAGGHLALRLLDPDIGLAPNILQRIRAVCAISPLSDLTPLKDMPMNADLRLDPHEARAESPRHQPPPAADISILVGADERPAFIDQALWMADAWPDAKLSILAGLHHFNIIEALEDPDSGLVRRLCRDDA